MSRIGRKPVVIPNGVEVKVGEDNVVTVSGKLGTLSQKIDKIISVKIEDGVIHLTRPNDLSEQSVHG